MLHIGCHLSSSKGYRHMGEEALSIGADTFQFFTRNPRGSKAKQVNPKDAEALRDMMRAHTFAPILGHAPYTLNACAVDEGLREFARSAMREDIRTGVYSAFRFVEREDGRVPRYVPRVFRRI